MAGSRLRREFRPWAKCGARSQSMLAAGISVRCGKSSQHASSGIQLVVAAVAEGMQAAFAINNAMLEADAESGLLKHTGESALQPRKSQSKQRAQAQALRK